MLIAAEKMHNAFICLKVNAYTYINPVLKERHCSNLIWIHQQNYSKKINILIECNIVPAHEWIPPFSTKYLLLFLNCIGTMCLQFYYNSKRKPTISSAALIKPRRIPANSGILLECSFRESQQPNISLDKQSFIITNF